MLKARLVVDGVDLDDHDTSETMGGHLSDMLWSQVAGRVTATVFVSDADVARAAALHVRGNEDRGIVDAVLAKAARIHDALPGARVTEVDEELVSASDIAFRVGLNRETVRAYAVGLRGPGRFPCQVATLGEGGRGATRVWRWADVNAWFRDNYGAGDDHVQLTRSQVLATNAALAGFVVSPGSWRQAVRSFVQTRNAQPVSVYTTREIGRTDFALAG